MSVSHTLDTEASIGHHLLHKSARKILFSSRNVRKKWIKRNNINTVSKEMRNDSNFYFFCQYFVDKTLTSILPKNHAGPVEKVISD